MEHYYHFDIFNEVLDFVITKLKTRFNDPSIELLPLSTTLDSRDSFESFNGCDIHTLAEKF